MRYKARDKALIYLSSADGRRCGGPPYRPLPTIVVHHCTIMPDTHSGAVRTARMQHRLVWHWYEFVDLYTSLRLRRGLAHLRELARLRGISLVFEDVGVIALAALHQ